MTDSNKIIGVIGLGYVGLPLAVEFGKKYVTVGYDSSSERIEGLQKGVDKTLEVTGNDLKSSSFLELSKSLEDIKRCNFYILTVPTPINDDKTPDLSFIESATKSVGSVLSKGDVVIYESTVYPGLTEDFCVPILEEISGLIFNKDFYCGYSPERINPGDKQHKVTDIIKVTSGSTPEISQTIDELYSSIIPAGTYIASSIKVAEMAKVIENTQRDVNIALINEFSQICKKLDIDAEEVLKTSETKWNFIPFRPGLVGGHCIGVDPYYLTYLCQKIDHTPEVILAGRMLNDAMPKYVADDVIKLVKKNGKEPKNLKILIMGLTFKENCPDVRNSGSFKVFDQFEKQGFDIDLYDPWVDQNSLKDKYKTKTVQDPRLDFYDVIVITTAHKIFIEMGIEKIRSFGNSDHLLYDMKYIFKSDSVDARL